MSFKTTATIASFGGRLLKLTHNASTTGCEMALNLYLPPQAMNNKSHKVPVIFYLAGLTCTGDNGAEKGFFQHGASQNGIAIVYPDTSPSKPVHILQIPIITVPQKKISNAAFQSHRRSQTPRRRRLLGLRHRRRLLPRRHARPLCLQLQNVQLHHLRAPRRPVRTIPRTRWLSG